MPARIALVTDIHGNYPALQAVLRDIGKLNVEHIYGLGDMIGIGPNSNQVLETLFSRDDVSLITGNHDEAVLAILHDEPYPPSHAKSKGHHEWIASQLSSTFIKALSALPRSLDVQYGDTRLLMRHYHMDESGEKAHISDDPYAPIDVNPSLESLERRYSESGYEVICFGHHHPTHYFRSDERLYLNPGSLGCYEKPYARYTVLTIDGARQWSAEMREVHYDNRDFLRSYERLNVPGREFILKIFHGNQLAAE